MILDLKKSIIQSALSVITASLYWTRSARRYSGLGHILMFHSVLPQGTTSQYEMAKYEVTPELLTMIIKFYIKAGYEFISLDHMHDKIVNNDASNKCVVFTFDDGYKDVLEYAYPILKHNNVPFCIYVVANYADGNAIKWDYLIENVIEDRATVAVETQAASVELDCSTLKKKGNAIRMLFSLMHSMNDPEHIHLIRKFFKTYSDMFYDKTRELTLDWSMIRAISRDPLVTIGAHTVNHYCLSKLTESAARDEILGSKRTLETKLDREILHFAYPYGGPAEADDREFKLVKQGGFKTGTTTRVGNISSEDVHHLECLPRYRIGADVNERYLRHIATGSLALLKNRFKTAR